MSALIASLFAVGASPAAAIDDKSKADHATSDRACVGEALDDHGFTDLGTLSATVPNINCLAYYGITIGKTADTFDPNSNVTRSEMALFLYRAAKLMDVDLMGGDMMVDYGDIAELGEDRQNAITALARNGILSGRGSMAFEPGADITRAEMAVALVSLVDHASDVVNKAKSGANQGLFVFGSAPGSLPNDNFTDVIRTQPRHVNNAISAAYELGITSGKSLDVFDPDGSVPRRDMATFIINAANHTNLRPAGLTAQRSGTTITASVRDADFAPVPNAHIDAFSATNADAGGAFKADGSCRSSRTSLVDGGTACEIDGADPITQSDGNTTLAAVTDVGEGRTVWLWTGDFGDKYGSDTDSITVDVPKGASGPVMATSVDFSNDLNKKPDDSDVDRVHFGATVTVTLQLQGANDANAPAPPGNPVKYSVTRTSRSVAASVTAATIDAVGGRAAVFADTSNTGLLRSDPAEVVTIGPDGSATFTLTASDSDANNRGQRTVVRAVVTPVTQGQVGSAPATTGTEGTMYFVFSDESPAVTSVSIETGGSQSAPASGRVGTAVTVSVADQYGNPVHGAEVALFSNDETGTGDTVGSSIPRNAAGDGPREYSTLRSGSVRIGYTYTGGASQESLVAIWDGYVAATTDADGNAVAAVGTEGYGATPIATDGTVTCQDSGSAGADVCSTSTEVNWVRPVSTRDSVAARTILSIDTDDGQIIVNNAASGTTPNSINYDSNDYFLVDDTDDDTDNFEPKSMDEFVKAVTKGLADNAKAEAGGGSADTITLAWTGYIADDASAITQFSLDLD
ncbi:MAG: S-layer homology domain-containing protein [Acidimicrobiaceae bacterium]|nr:S-layer homology domain-containing protein [Acidimicrobiaceae bacterium]MYJ30256.1 S-layer homology domain-containing protein [Acidimicrobiaceae bacterium]MYJ83537.1 S-layer homology domain-containing protein [Acidimicrobiaceae bacterium]